MRIYINGVRNLEEARQAVNMGANAVGIRLGYEQEAVNPEVAREIFFALPMFVSRVGIFYNQKRYDIQELVTFCRLDTLHFIGNETPEDLERYSENMIKDLAVCDLNQAGFFQVQAISVDLDSKPDVDKSVLPKDRLCILRGSFSSERWIFETERLHPYAVQLMISQAEPELVRNLLVR